MRHIDKVRMLFLNYATQYRVYGRREDYEAMCTWYRRFLELIKDNL